MNVFMIETSHQLLNAIEAKHRLGLQDCRLVIMVHQAYPRGAYEVLVDREEWTAVHYVKRVEEPVDPSSFWFRFSGSDRMRGYFATLQLRKLRQQLDALARSMGEAERIFLGNYWVEYMRHFANVLPHERVWLLDDGTATLLINDRRRQGRPLDKLDSFQRMKVRLIDRAIGMRTCQERGVTFFTIYELESRAEDQVFSHDYAYLRSVAEGGEASDEVFFLGQTLIDEGLSRGDYMDYLKKVLDYFAGEKLVYVAHKGEPADKVAYIENELGVPVRRFGVPIEYQLTVRRSKPKLLASFCSSALENCRVIFGDELQIRSFYIDPARCKSDTGLIGGIYDYYRSKAGPAFKVVQFQA